ncbi:MAG TPA: dTDP-glucose 4,6-dehydratase [Anaerolinea thermolimosa]|uniref:dTDP-glucose 4,6-dehydratase n=1 Tax=Anaerolinea thermolimosa TaxID=229919 RepID=A0A3D1JI37_9CHLR|nr:dTDP-glucose 4,6-dehydratase [Anaerolinea thermolimosa]GAP05403.1 dTDP-glucose 4,6-dehydratase [Anaerolinea thermolimosa]HCE18241.1 dTDP-glucose 4,6-dehydratase [Anaerolinea thermolimosa]
MPKQVLVTGGAGFIGSNFVRYLLQTDPEVTIINLDALTYAGSLENLNDLPDPARHHFIHGDICDRPLVDRLFHEYAIDTVVHFAAESHVDRSILGPGQFIQTNIIGTFTLLEAARQAWLTEKTVPIEQVRFHHVSTDEVFGSLAPEDPAFTESTPYAPRSPYSASKAASDHLVRAYHHTYGLPVTLSNCSNNYGPYQYPEKLIPLMILNALHGKDLPVYGDGKQVRDWLYVVDHCEAIWRVVTGGQSGETYNIGGGNQPTNLEVVHTLCDILDELAPTSPHRPHRNLIRFVQDRPGHDRRYAMDITKIGHELGWRPRMSLTTGLLETVRWYLDHPDWIEAVRKGSDLQKWLERNYAQRGGNP